VLDESLTVMRVFVEIALWVIVLSEINDDDNASKGNINKKTRDLSCTLMDTTGIGKV